MTRHNRQKLHRSLRLVAEARKQTAAARRAAERARRAAVEGQVQVALRRPAAAHRDPLPSSTPLIPRADQWLVLAGVARPVRGDVCRLFAAVREAIPAWYALEAIDTLVLLARRGWGRRLDTWNPMATAASRRQHALLQHLMGPWSLPPALLGALQVGHEFVARVPVEYEWMFVAASQIARGRPLHEVAGTADFPTPLTRRMCHLFVRAAADRPPIEALRFAQVSGLGGPPQLVSALLRTRLRTVQGDGLAGEGWWQEVIAWLVAHPGFLPRELPDLIDALDRLRRSSLRTGRRFELAGRTVASLRRLVERDLVVSRAIAEGGPCFYSGLRGLRHEVDGSRWEVVELPTAEALAREGCAMNHCVAMYLPMASAGRVCLWSLRRDGKSAVTIEVVPAKRAIVQVKGFANRAVNGVERHVIQVWAARNELLWAC